MRSSRNISNSKVWRIFPGSFIGCTQFQCLVDSVGVVVSLKLPQHFFQIAFVPEKCFFEVFPPNGVDEPLGKGMSNLRKEKKSLIFR